MSNWEDKTCIYEQREDTDSEKGDLKVDLNASQDVPGLDKGQGIPGKNKNTEVTKPWKESQEQRVVPADWGGGHTYWGRWK